MTADMGDRSDISVTPFIIVNFSPTKHLHLPKDQVVAFAEKDTKDGEVYEISSMEEIEKELPRNWVPERKHRDKLEELINNNPFSTKAVET